MKLFSLLFMVIGFIFGETIVYPKLRLKFQKRWRQILIYIVYIMLIVSVSAVINIYEHGYGVTTMEIKKMILVLITSPIILLLIKMKISVSSL